MWWACRSLLNLHLESRANDELQLSQLDEVLRDVSTHSSEYRLILAGDLNLNAAKTGPAEKLFAAGFCSAVPSARIAITPGASFARSRLPYRLGLCERPNASR